MSWLNGYSTRRKLTIDCTKVDSALSDFPILVKLTSTQLDFAKANADGFDIRFTSSDGTTLLKYERERHDNGNSLAEYWVKVTSIASASDTDIYMYYRTTDTADGADITNVWDSNFEVVMHLKDDPDTSTVQDSTSNNKDGTKTSANNPIEATGLIDKGQDFSGDKIDLGTDIWTSAEMANGTVEFFLTTDDAGSGDRQPINFEDIVVMRMLNTHFQALVNDGGWKVLEGTTTPTVATWYHIAQTWDGSLLTLYVNAIGEGTPIACGGPAFDGSHYHKSNLGEDPNNGRHWNGKMDEFRFSNSCRTGAWLKASKNSGMNTLLTYGSEETKPEEEGNFFQLF